MCTWCGKDSNWSAAEFRIGIDRGGGLLVFNYEVRVERTADGRVKATSLMPWPNGGGQEAFGDCAQTAAETLRARVEREGHGG